MTSISFFYPHLKKCYLNGTIQFVTFRDWLFSLCIISWLFVQVIVCSNSWFLFNCWVVLHGADVPKFYQPCLMKDIWVVSSFWLLQIKLLWIFAYRFLGKCKFSFLWDKCSIDGYGKCVSSLIRNCQTVSRGWWYRFIFTSANVRVTQFLCFPASIWCCRCFLFQPSW